MIELSAGYRLHIQLLDPSGLRGYRRGGIGIALLEPRISIIVANKDEAVKVKGFSKTTLLHLELKAEPFVNQEVVSKLCFYVNTKVFNHIGLGSGTLIRTLARIGIEKQQNLVSGKDDDLYSLASLTGVGQYTTMFGGFVMVGTVPTTQDLPATIIKNRSGIRTSPLLLTRLDMPRSWKVLLCIPKANIAKGLTGNKEFQFYKGLKSPSQQEINQNLFEIINGIIPAIHYKNYGKFCESMRIISGLNWKKYEQQLHSEFWKKTSNVLSEAGCPFVAMSSGGPTTFTIIDTQEFDVTKRIEAIQTHLSEYCTIKLPDFSNTSYSIEKETLL